MQLKEHFSTPFVNTTAKKLKCALTNVIVTLALTQCFFTSAGRQNWPVGNLVRPVRNLCLRSKLYTEKNYYRKCVRESAPCYVPPINTDKGARPGTINGGGRGHPWEKATKDVTSIEGESHEESDLNRGRKKDRRWPSQPHASKF